MDEQALMDLVKAGDEKAFGQIVSHYKDRIVNFLYQTTGDYEKAVELSQETFLRVYFKADKYLPIAPFSSWIYTIASNLAKTELRRNRKYLTVSLDDVKNDLSAGTFSVGPSDSGLSKNLRRALDALSPRYRIPVILKDVEGYSQEEIAQIINKPVGTVKARISRGRSMLRRALERAAGGSTAYVLNKEYENERA